ncbi:Ribonuclease [Symmachiella macrocystis]|uniref:Ribonuclease n=1 Tax=Symmachiella macrocystis TaxID=2527985 RepID=A0A5C6BS20_9PLAN|nr:Ribonuclease [Symmachiella macrocystis]
MGGHYNGVRVLKLIYRRQRRLAVLGSATEQGGDSLKITFCGAAGEVTGSQHLLEFGDLRVLLDCGFFQGRRAESRRKNETFRCDPPNLDAVILSHAHIDHCGNLPGLYRAGFRGPVFCTDPTADVADIMLLDSARIQAEDAKYLARHLERGQVPPEPLYDEDDVRAVVQLMEPMPYNEWFTLNPALRLRFVEAGHILGSAICELEFKERARTRRLVFTGDLGRRNLPLLHDPQPVDGCDILISESTYGNRVHPPAADLKQALLEVIQEAVHEGGKVIIPAFSLGRTQRVVYFLNQLTNEGLLPEVPVFVDSPLSNRLTSVYRRHAELLDADVQSTLMTDADAFGFHGLTYIGNRQESMALNRRKGPFVVIAASGMCENGRVVHHLKNSVEDPKNRIVIIGFQAAHTLGRRIVERREKVSIFNRHYKLKAQVKTLNGLSAHADVEDFKWWYDQLASRGGVRQAFLVHGEPESSQSLATILRDYCDEDPIIPQQFESFEV